MCLVGKPNLCLLIKWNAACHRSSEQSPCLFMLPIGHMDKDRLIEHRIECHIVILICLIFCRFVVLLLQGLKRGWLWLSWSMRSHCVLLSECESDCSCRFKPFLFIFNFQIYLRIVWSWLSHVLGSSGSGPSFPVFSSVLLAFSVAAGAIFGPFLLPGLFLSGFSCFTSVWLVLPFGRSFGCVL